MRGGQRSSSSLRGSRPAGPSPPSGAVAAKPEHDPAAGAPLPRRTPFVSSRRTRVVASRCRWKDRARVGRGWLPATRVFKSRVPRSCGEAGGGGSRVRRGGWHHARLVAGRRRPPVAGEGHPVPHRRRHAHPRERQRSHDAAHGPVHQRLLHGVLPQPDCGRLEPHRNDPGLGGGESAPAPDQLPRDESCDGDLFLTK